MSKKRQQPPRQAILGNSVRWLPLLAIPFGVLFAETWMQLEHYHLDYLTSKVGTEIRELKDDIKELNNLKANLEALERLDVMAVRLGLGRPGHNQIVIVRAPAGTPEPGDDALRYARLKGSERAISPVAPATGE
jgi:hypothetical protein